MDATTTQLWDQVFKTDPKHTKAFTRGGGFKGTATNALYLIHKATSIWGPMGSKWGVEIVEDKMLQGAPMIVDGQVIGHEIVHCVTINLFYPDGKVPAFGQTTFVSKNKNGIFTDEEAPKKSLTDATTKALSWLGFSADIHMGLYDDNKYVNDLRREFAEQSEPSIDIEKHLAAVTAKLEKIGEVDALNAEWNEAIAGIPDNHVPRIEAAFKARARQIKQAGKTPATAH
jgi:hypothetical protein